MKQRWAWLVPLTLPTLMACGPGAPTLFYQEDFETLCEGVPCGWERTSGDITQATWVETIHPGEHGLRLEGQASVRGTVAGEPGAAVATESLFVELIARCDPGSELRVDVVLADEFGGPFIASAIAAPEPEWACPLGVTLTSDGSRANATRVMAIGVAKTGAGVCEISAITIDPSPFPSGC